MMPEHATTIDMLIDDIIKYYEWGDMKLDQAYIIALRDYSSTMITILKAETNKPSKHDLMLISAASIMHNQSRKVHDISIIINLYKNRDN